MNIDLVRNLVFPTPPLSEQKRIVAKLDELMILCDELEAQKQKTHQTCIQLNEASIDKLLTAPTTKKFKRHWKRIYDNFDLLYSKPENVIKLRQAVFQLAVKGKLVSQSPKDEPASVLLEKIEVKRSLLIKNKVIRKNAALEATEPGEIPFKLPSNWEWSRLGSVIKSYQNGCSTRTSDQGIKTIVIRLADIKSDKIVLSDSRKILLSRNQREKYALQEGDILITRVNGSVDLVGSFTYVGAFSDVCYCDHFIRMRSFAEHVHPHYLTLVGKSELVRDRIKALFITTAGQKTVNQRHISSIPIPIPPLNEQIRIVQKVNELVGLCDILEERLDKSQKNSVRLMEAIATDMIMV